MLWANGRCAIKWSKFSVLGVNDLPKSSFLLFPYKHHGRYRSPPGLRVKVDDLYLWLYRSQQIFKMDLTPAVRICDICLIFYQRLQARLTVLDTAEEGWMSGRAEDHLDGKPSPLRGRGVRRKSWTRCFLRVVSGSVFFHWRSLVRVNVAATTK